MKVEYIDTKFVLLDSATVDGKKYILGSDEVLCNIVDLCTYGWKFFPSISYEPLELLVKEQKPLNKLEAEAVRKTLFPTISNSPVDTTINYFGSISSGSQKLYMLSVPGGSKEVIFYEGSSQKIKITLDEKDDLLVWFVISKDVVSNINLAYYSWINSQVPHRNYKDHVIGDEETIEVVEKEGAYWIDKASGTILANSESSSTPLLDTIKARFQNDKSWSHRVHYKKGDTILQEGVEWIALEDNINSYPLFSSSWILKSIISKFRKDISIITCSHGEVSPSIIPTPNGSSLTLESIKLEYGYILSGFLKESFNSYIDETYRLNDITVDCLKSKGALKVLTEKMSPLIEVYINGDPMWPKNSFSDEGITKRLSVDLGQSFITDSTLTTRDQIGEILGITKSYLGENDEVLGTTDRVDSLYIGEATTPVLSDTITLPCKKVRYNISLTYDYIRLIINEHPGFYVNTIQQSSLTNEIKKFYIKPIKSSVTSCSVDIILSDTDKATISVNSVKLEDVNVYSSTNIKLSKEVGMFILSVEKPIRNFKFNVYGS